MAENDRSSTESDYFAIRFEGTPGPGENPGLIDVVNSKGESIPAGEWVRVEDPSFPEWDLWEMRFYIRHEDGKTILEPPKSQELLVSMELVEEGEEAAEWEKGPLTEPTYKPKLRTRLQ